MALLGREAVQGHVGVELQDVLLQLVLLQLHTPSTRTGLHGTHAATGLALEAARVK